MLALQTHWRNLWRNRRRTLITVSAVTLNTAVLILLVSFVNGMYAQMARTTTDVSLGDVQVHAPEYLQNRQLHFVIKDPQAILDRASADGIGAAPRLYGYGLTAVHQKSSGSMIWGVVPAAEKANFRLPTHIASGRFLADDPVARGQMPEVVIGGKLAKTLGATVGDELLAFIQAADGSGFDTLFRVVGILQLVAESVDRTAAIIHADEFRRIFYPPAASAWYMHGGDDAAPVVERPPDPPPAGGGFELFEDFNPESGPGPAGPSVDLATWTPPFIVHEIALNAPDGMEPAAVKSALAPVLGTNDAKTWREINPAMASLVEASGASMAIFSVVFFGVAALGVLNTMLMATWERMREFGVMKAIGTSPWRLVGDVAGEAAVLGVFSALAGGVLGAIVTIWLSRTGIDLSGVLEQGASFAGVAMDPVMRPEFDVADLPYTLIGMAFTCVLASLYPAFIAARVDPAKILHDQ